MAFEAHCIVEIMGHQVIAGKVSEETHFGAPLMRVDVPKSSKREGFTVFYGGNSIYKITPTTEQIVLAFVEKQDPEPIKPYMLALPTLVNKVLEEQYSDYDPDLDDDSYPDDEDDDDYPYDPQYDPDDEYDRRKDDLDEDDEDEDDDPNEAIVPSAAEAAAILNEQKADKPADEKGDLPY